MKFEDLANEILIETFERIDFVELFRAFYGLNQRLNQLIFIPYRNYCLQFRSISKSEFDIICQHHLLTIVNRVVSLSLSNNDETPNLPEYFLSYGFNLNQFSHLRYFSLDSIHSLSTLNRLLSQCRHLLYFTHLFIRRCHFQNQHDFSILLNNIWNLSKLIYCTIDHPLPYKLKFIIHNMIISPTIEYLSMEKFRFDGNDLSNLFQCTPSLRYFSGTIKSSSNSDQLSFMASSIISMKLVFRGSISSLTSILQKVPNLNHLTIQTKDIDLNGYEWRKIIQAYVPQLKEFQMKMDFKLSHSNDIEEQLNYLVNSFSDSYWIKRRQWFVRCDWISTTVSHFGTLYTIPYAFDDFLLINKQWSKSTAIIDQEYNHVNKLTMMNIRTFLYRDVPDHAYNFEKISYLKLHLPLTDTFWSFVQSFNRLKSLEVMLFEGCSYLPLQTLLDHSPLLSSLCLSKFNTLKIIDQLKSASISRLDFITRNTYKRYCDRTQCNILVSSSLGQQCEVLLINLENRESLFQLINGMFKLRSLIFQCKDDRGDDEILQWLHTYLPSTYSIQRDEFHSSQIRLWIA